MDLKAIQEAEYQGQKGLISKIRSKVMSLFGYGNNIERLMKDKVEDFILLEEQPTGIRIGERTIYVGTFTWENENLFWDRWIEILSLIQTDKINFDLLSDSRELYKALKLHRKLYKRIIVLIYETLVNQQQYFYCGDKKEKVFWKNAGLGYLMKHMTTEKLIQICLLIYTYNFDAEKKNLQLVLGLLQGKQREEMYIYSWLRNLGGLTGKFLRSQAPSIDLIFADTTSPSNDNGQRKNTEGETA